MDRDQDHGGDQWSSKTHDTVCPPILSKIGRINAAEEDKKDVESHGERPPRVRLHEPAEASAVTIQLFQIESEKRIFSMLTSRAKREPKLTTGR